MTTRNEPPRGKPDLNPSVIVDEDIAWHQLTPNAVAKKLTEVRAALDAGAIDRAQFDLLAVAINTDTNIPSIATPNGQAAFLCLLTSGLAPLIRLSYFRMVIMALPYVLTMTTTGFLAIIYFL